jgi:hypothetical protein
MIADWSLPHHKPTSLIISYYLIENRNLTLCQPAD